MRSHFPLILVAASFLLAACGGSGTGADAGSASGSDATSSSSLDAAAPDAALSEPPDAAEPPDADAYDAGPACTKQAECGNPVTEDIANTCVGGHCVLPGPLVNVDFESYYDQAYSQPGFRPQVQLTRLFLGTRLDGVPLTCADLLARSGATEATRAKIDTDPLLNQSFRNLTVLSWTGSTVGQALFRLFYDAPRGPDYVLFAEAWYGPRSGDYGTGARAAAACTEHVDLSTAVSPKLTILFKP